MSFLSPKLSQLTAPKRYKKRTDSNQRSRSNQHISLKSHTSAFSNSYRRLTRPSGFIRSLLNTSAKCNNPFSRNRCDAAVGRYDKQMR